jgi:hypothetical protein
VDKIQALESNWVLVYTYQKQAGTVPPYPQIERYSPIPDWTTATTLDSPIIAINATSDTAPDNWRYAGTALQEIRSGLSVGGQPDTTVAAKRFWLNQLTLLWFPDLGPDYNILFRIPYWIRSIDLTVFNYIGPVTKAYDPILDQILNEVTSV